MALLKNYPTEQSVTLEDGSILTVSTENIVEKVTDKIIKNHAIESIGRTLALHWRHISGATARAQQKRRDAQIAKTGESKIEPAWPSVEDEAEWQKILETMQSDSGKQVASYTFDLEKHHEKLAASSKRGWGKKAVTKESAGDALKAAFYSLRPHGTEIEYLTWALGQLSGRPTSDIDLEIAKVPEGETTSGEAITA